MSIIITTPIMPPQIGGPATYVSQLVRELGKKHQITILTFTQHPLPIRGVRTVVIPLFPHRFGTLLRQATLAVRLISVAKFADIVYAQGPIVTGLTSAVVGKFFRKRVIVKFVGDIAWEEAERRGEWVRGLDEFLKSGAGSLPIQVIKLAQRISLGLATRIVVPSRFLKLLLTRHYGIHTDRIEVIPNAVRLPALRESAAGRGKTIITSGRLVKHKRIDLMIEAFSRLLRKPGMENANLLIIGDGPEQQNLKSQVTNLKLGKRVKLEKSLDRKRYLKLLAGADLFVLASSYEGLPHAIIEAQLLGVPVIASDIPGNREVIDHLNSGLLVPAKSLAIAEVMLKVLQDKELTRKMVDNAKTKAAKKFNWKTHLERLVHLFGQESSPA